MSENERCGDEQVVIGQKLIDRQERFDRVVIDKKIDSRESYFKGLEKLEFSSAQKLFVDVRR